MTFAEFARLPDDEQGYVLELLDGELIRFPPAYIAETRIRHRIFHVIDPALGRMHSQGLALELGETFMRNGYLLDSSFLIPDFSATYAGQPEGNYLEGSPALAAEVICDFHLADPMHCKIRRYIEHGAREVWEFYPDTRSVIVHRGDRATEITGTLTTDLFPGLTINLAEIFAA